MTKPAPESQTLSTRCDYTTRWSKCEPGPRRALELDDRPEVSWPAVGFEEIAHPLPRSPFLDNFRRADHSAVIALCLKSNCLVLHFHLSGIENGLFG